ncbi:hypothetical protein [Ferrimonas aestuarii]|uniref:Uncharacterized protein n=1 Tax=Ferrimonas aestuarii TaxID=2569539 RepID=A0A4U1BRL8_9GAMM|nr:hypothetical protein [Ferrimonas aestuarii]TKB56818.1 hypothetical protein FCL42_06705 [Ferrimonas aestuarii]
MKTVSNTKSIVALFLGSMLFSGYSVADVKQEARDGVQQQLNKQIEQVNYSMNQQLKQDVRLYSAVGLYSVEPELVLVKSEPKLTASTAIGDEE